MLDDLVADEDAARPHNDWGKYWFTLFSDLLWIFENPNFTKYYFN
jgi:hypothetical protein